MLLSSEVAPAPLYCAVSARDKQASAAQQTAQQKEDMNVVKVGEGGTEVCKLTVCV